MKLPFKTAGFARRVMTRASLRAICLAASLAVPGGAIAATPASNHAVRAHELIEGLDFDEARKELGQASIDDALAALERAYLAIYELDCDGAVAILQRPELAASEEARSLMDIAQGCARVTAATVVEKDDAKNGS